MEQSEIQKLVQFFQVMANESRLKIVGILANRPCSVSEIADLVELKEPTVSHHLSMLKELGLVQMQPQGNLRIYSLNQEALIRLNKEMFSPDKIARLVGRVDEQSWEDKVRATFIINDRIAQIPSQYKKYMVVLRWLADRFEFDRRYPEKELNELIKQYHPDYASLRRYMIDEKLMARENGIYWRLPTAQAE